MGKRNLKCGDGRIRPSREVSQRAGMPLPLQESEGLIRVKSPPNVAYGVTLV